jgi:hypothetical protein
VRAGTLFEIQGGLTSEKNFPASYFEFGGLPSLATGVQAFASRGFAYQLAYGPKMFRIAAESAWSLSSLSNAISWNRARLMNLDAKVIAETVSFSGIGNSRYQWGVQYFTTAGAELEFIGQGLNYIQWKASLGIYQGFGRFGDTRFAVTLRSGLDL